MFSQIRFYWTERWKIQGDLFRLMSAICLFCLVDPNSNNHFTEKRCHWLLSHTILHFKLIVDLENSFKNKYLFYFSFLMILLHRPPNNEFYCVSFRTRSVTKQTWPFLRYLYCVFTSPQIITHSMCFYCSHHLM